MPERKKDRSASGAAIAAGGGVVAGTGLVAGGVPGAKSNFAPVANMKPGEGRGVRRVANTVRQNKGVVRAAPGGILGFRQSAHRGGLYGFATDAEKHAKTGAKTPHEAFFQGRNAGKIEPELKILRHMGRGKKAAAGALVGGAGTSAYGVKRSRDEVKKSQRDSDKYNGTLVGAGAAGAGVSHGANRVLRGQQNKWATRASDSVDRAGKLVPSIDGRQGKKLTLRQMHKHKLRNPGQAFPKTMYPKVSDSDIKRDPKLLSGVKTDVARKAGHLRGAAAQERHFAEVYGNTAKVVGRLRTPSAIVAAAGAGGLAASRRKDKVKKNMSPFGVDHG